MSNLSSPKVRHNKAHSRSGSDQVSPSHGQKVRDVVGNSNIKVICRFRPRNEHETSHGYDIVKCPSPSTVTIGGTDHPVNYTFDRVFDKDATQLEIYQYSINQTVEDFFLGYNGTILAYGQTGSGKSYTMMGTSISDNMEQGIIPRISNEIFDKINNSSSDIEYTVGVSYMEIYMEQIKDLLETRPDSNKKYIIQEDKVDGIHVKGLSQAFVSSSKELNKVLKQGSKVRANALTNMNLESSRSHAILQINLSQKHLSNDTIKKSHLFLVDLAGSEKIDKTGAVGQTLEEAKKINSSLSALGNVINSLTDGKSTHIPYRDSKLSRILQESLGGNSRTSLIINCSPSSINELETLSTLRFGSRAKNIKNNAHINTEMSTSSLQLKIQSLEKINRENESYIEKLENELSKRRNTEFRTSQDTTAYLENPSDKTIGLPAHEFNSQANQSSGKMTENLQRRDNKISELENIILNMKMENLKLSHQEDSKLFKLENSLHKLHDKLNDVELVNNNLRKHLLISEKIIESRDIKINSLRNSLNEQHSQVSRDGANFESKLSSIRKKLDLYAIQKASEQVKERPAASDDTNRGINNYNSLNANNTGIDNVLKSDINTTNIETSGMANQSDSSMSPKIGLNLNIVKPLRGGRSYFDEDSHI